MSTMIWPVASSSTCARSMGRGAGPSKLIPSGVYPLPWQGHLNLCSAGFQSGVQPRCVQRAKITKMRSRFADHPDAVLGLEALIHARLEIRRVPDFENRAGFEKCARKEKAEEHQKIGGEKTPNTTPDDSTPHFCGGRNLFSSRFAFRRMRLWEQVWEEWRPPEPVPW